MPNCQGGFFQTENEVAPERLSKERQGAGGGSVCGVRGVGSSALYKGTAPGFLFSGAGLQQTSGPLGRAPAGTPPL